MSAAGAWDEAESAVPMIRTCASRSREVDPIAREKAGAHEVTHVLWFSSYVPTPHGTASSRWWISVKEDVFPWR